MHERLARDPYEALGLTGSPTPADIRQAFLGLTKQFHPARFGRMSSEIQRLANEVFLGLRAAHDQLARPSVKPRQTGMIPIQRAATPPVTGPATRPSADSLPVTPRTTTPTGAPPTRPSAPILNAPHNPGHHGTSPLRPLGATPAPSSAPTAAPAKFPATTPATRPGVTPASTAPQPRPAAPRPPAPPGGVPIRSRTPSTGNPIRSSTPPMGVRFNAPGTAAAAAAQPPQPPRAPAAPQPADRELTPILALLDMGQFAACRVALESLVARSPNVPRYRALIAYSKGREAQLARRLDEARVELQEALQIDPGLDLAKTALGELFTRRK